MSVSMSVSPGCLCGTAGHPACLSPAAVLLKLVKSSSLASSEPVPLALNFLVLPKMWVYAEGLPSGVSFAEASLQLLPCAWTCAPAHFWLSAELTQWLPVLRCSFWSLPRWASSESWGAAQRPTITERSVKPDLMVWPKWPNPVVYFFSWYRFTSCQRQGKACWKLKRNGANSALSSNWACLGCSEELLSTDRNERQNYGLLCSENRVKTLGLETAHQWQRSFFKRNNKSISGWKA